MGMTRRRVRLCLAAAAFLFVLWATVKTLFAGNKCNMGDNLRPIVVNVLDTFEKHKIQVYLDDGTLLGFYRDGKVMDYEFDVDLSIQKPQLEAVIALREEFKEKFGYSLYSQTDFIWQKGWTMLYTFTWQPYLGEAPCARIYDVDKWYYADIYCDERVSRDEMLNITKFPPVGWDDPKNADKMYLCEMELEAKECCMPEDLIFPLKTLRGLDRDLPVPNDIPGVLSQVYGPDGWQTPRAKGIKSIICNRTGWWLSVLLCLGLLLLLSIPIRAELRERDRPRLPLSVHDKK